MKRLLLITVLLLTGSAAVAYEEPEYEVLRSNDAYEIRYYAPYIVAEVDVNGNFRRAGNAAFRILAGYIFGDNKPNTKMSMTVPVESVEPGQKMRMTVPVESVAATSPTTGSAREASVETYTYAFVMERAYTMDTLPKPDDSRIRLIERPARTMAVNRYSGSARESRYEKEKRALLRALEEDGVETTGTPIFARYNGPMTPWFLKRNEVMIEIQETE